MCCRQHKMTQHRRQHRNSSNFLSGQTWQGPGQESSPVHNYSPDTTLLLLLLPLVNILSLGNCWKRGKKQTKKLPEFFRLAVRLELFLQISASCVLFSWPVKDWSQGNVLHWRKEKQAGDRVTEEPRFPFGIGYKSKCRFYPSIKNERRLITIEISPWHSWWLNQLSAKSASR